MPIMKFKCRVLCRIKIMVIYIPAAPPKADTRNNVLSLILYFPFTARRLSDIHIITDNILTKKIYNAKASM